MNNLRELQTLLYQLITGPDRLNGDGYDAHLLHDGELLVRTTRDCGASERIAIYANAYFHRLLDCLMEDYPATLAVIGLTDFTSVARDYLVWRPPTEPSIFHAGRYLADFLCHHSIRRRWPFIAELTRLERATLVAFHAPDAPSLTDDAMRRIPPEQWPAVELRLHPAVEILRGEWRVSEVLSAVEAGEKLLAAAHERTSVIVWRQGARVRYRIIQDGEAEAMMLMQKGASFAVICEALASASSTSDQAASIWQLLTRWLADGVIASPDWLPMKPSR